MSFDDDYSCASAPVADAPAPVTKREAREKPAARAAPIRRPPPPRARPSEARGAGSVSVRRGVRVVNAPCVVYALSVGSEEPLLTGFARVARRALRRPPGGTGPRRRMMRSSKRLRSAHSDGPSHWSPCCSVTGLGTSRCTKGRYCDELLRSVEQHLRVSRHAEA